MTPIAVQNEKGLIGLAGRVRTLSEYAESDMSKREAASFKNRSWFLIWLDSLDRRQYPSLTFTPPVGMYVGEDGMLHHQMPETTGMFNLYTGAAIPPEDTGPANEDWASHPIVKDFLATYHDAYSPTSHKMREWYLNYIAHNVQQPGVLPKCGAHAEGEQGTMKGFMVDIASDIIGVQYKHHALNLDSLTGRFANTYGKVVVFADEVSFSGDHRTQDVLKKLVTEGALTVEKKYMDAFVIENVAHFYSASNRKNALDIEASNRRFALLRTRSNKGRKMKLERFYTPEARRALAGYFYRRDISNYIPSDLPDGGNIEYEAKLRSLRGFQKWIVEYLQCPTAPFGVWVPKASIYAEYSSATPHAVMSHVFWRDMHQLFGAKMQEKRAGKGGWEGKQVCLPLREDACMSIGEALHIQSSYLMDATDEREYDDADCELTESRYHAAQDARQEDEEHCAAQAAQQQEEEHCAAQAAQQEDKDAEVALAESQLTDILANMNAAKSAHDNDMYDSDNENDPDIDPTLIDCMNDAFAHM
ncbi:TPA_asm: S3H [Monosiga MELD virus 1]|nr:TPA_asm: S3H [Monosiga MELD virus 1]